MTDPVVSTMQDAQLTITALLRHGQSVYADSVVRTFDGDRVGTFLWNTQEHLEAYFAVPSMGAVLHTLNLRLFPEQLAYVIDHGQDRVVIVDATVLPLLAKVADQIPTVEHYVLVGEGDTSLLGDVPVSRYEDLLAAAPARRAARSPTSAYVASRTPSPSKVRTTLSA